MVMVRRLIGAYAGETAEMEFPVALNAQRNGAVEIINEAAVLVGTHPGLSNNQLVSPPYTEVPQTPVADAPYDPAPKPLIVDPDGTLRDSIDPLDDPAPAAAGGPSPLPRVPLAAGVAGRRGR